MTSRANLARALRGRVRAGNSAIEFALIAPVLLVMLLGTVDLGLAIARKMQIQHAAQRGAERAVLGGFDAEAIAAAVSSASGQDGIVAAPAPRSSCGCAEETTIAPAECGTPCPSGAVAGTYVTVGATGSYTTLFPYPGLPSRFTFAEQATVRIQ